MELADEVESASRAQKQFKAEDVRTALDDLMKLVIRASDEFREYYSQSKASKHKFKYIPLLLLLNSCAETILKEFHTSRQSGLIALERELNRHRRVINNAFLTEIQSGITEAIAGVSNIQDDMRNATGGIESMVAHQKLHGNADSLDILRPPVDSKHYGKPMCLPGTREAVLERIYFWMSDDSRSSRLFWLFGVAGCGKSSIAATISEHTNVCDGLMGSFFCKRDEKDRSNPFRLVWSIAYQLARVNQGFKSALQSAIQNDDPFDNIDLDAQFRLLVENPLAKIDQPVVSSPLLFVIDALDECVNHEKVAGLLSHLINIAPWLLVFVTSRDVPGIRKGFAVLGESMKSHNLFDDDAKGDIRLLLEKELSPSGKLEELRHFVKNHHKNVLVEKAQGLFIWMRTAVEFIAGNEVGKQDLFERILNSEMSGKVEAALDDMYHVVLDGASTTALGRKVVQYIVGILLITSVTELLTINALHAFLPPMLNVSLAEFTTIFHRLLAILVVSRDGLVRAYHISFLEFAFSKLRIKDYWMDPGHLQIVMSLGCLEIMQKGTRNAKRQIAAPSALAFNICKLESAYCPNKEVQDLGQRIKNNISAELRYSSLHWLDHLQKVPSTEQYLEDAVTLYQAAESLFCSCRSLYWLEVMSLIESLPAARNILQTFSTDIKVWFALYQ